MANRRKCHRRNRTRSSTKTIRKTISATTFSFRRQRTISINITTTLVTTFDRNNNPGRVSLTPTPVKINSPKITQQVNTQSTSSCSTFSVLTHRTFPNTYASTNCFNTFSPRIQMAARRFMDRTSIFLSHRSNPTESTIISTERTRITSTDQVTRRTHTF